MAVAAIEQSPIYIDVAVKRWQDYTGKQAILEETGQTFDEVTHGNRPEANTDAA